MRICRSPFKSSYLENKKHFLSLLFHLWNLHQILNIFRKSKIVIGNVFPKLATVQGLVTPLTIQRRLKTSFNSQYVKRVQTLVKSSWGPFYHIFSSLWWESIWEISPWLKFEIIALFVNTWTSDYNYPVTDCENLPFPIQIQLSSKQNNFSRFFIPFMESPSNFEHYQKKEMVIANLFRKLVTAQRLVTPLTIQQRHKISFDSRHVKPIQTLVKSSWEHFWHIFSSMWGEMIWKISSWLKFEIIGFFLTDGLSITSILLRIVRICRSPFKSSYLKNKKHFLVFLLHLWNLHQILNTLKRKKIVRASVFPKLATVQGLVTLLTIQRRLKKSFDSRHVKPFQTLVKSSWEHF